MRSFKDNHLVTYRAIAAYILTSPLGAALEEYRRTRVHQASEADKVPDGWYFLDTEFSRAGTSASLTIRLEPEDPFSGRAIKDADGNEWQDYTLICQVNHPCHGSSDPATLMARCALWSQVAMLAAEIQATWHHVSQMTATALEVEQRKIKEEQERLRREVDSLVREHAKGLRVGKTSEFPMPQGTGLPAGNYQATFADHNFTLNVSEDRTIARLTRST